MCVPRVKAEADVQEAQCQGIRGSIGYVTVPGFRENKKNGRANFGIAQVEGYLKDISKGKHPDEVLDETSPDSEVNEVRRDGFTFTAGKGSVENAQAGPSTTPQFDIHEGGYTQQSQELMWLGQSETLPPFEAMEDLYVDNTALKLTSYVKGYAN